MRDGDNTAVRALGVLAVTAAVVLIVRLSQRVQKRQLLKDDALRTLRESGEFFFRPESG